MPAILPKEIKEIHTAYYAEQEGRDAEELDCSNEDLQEEVLPEWYDDFLSNSTRGVHAFYATVLTVPFLFVHPAFAILTLIGILYSGAKWSEAFEARWDD